MTPEEIQAAHERVTREMLRNHGKQRTARKSRRHCPTCGAPAVFDNIWHYQDPTKPYGKKDPGSEKP